MKREFRQYRIPTFQEVMPEEKGTATQIPSFNDVMTGAPEPSKKKVGTGSSTSALMSGIGSLSGLGRPSIVEGREAPPEQNKSGSLLTGLIEEAGKQKEDPVKYALDAISPEPDYLRTKVNNTDATYLQKPLGLRNTHEGFQTIKEQKELGQKIDQRNAAEKYIQDAIFPTGIEAKKYTEKVINENGGIPVNNKTFDMAAKVAHDYDVVSDQINRHGSIEGAAVEEYAKNNPVFAQQFKALQDKGYGTAAIPNSLMGVIKSEYRYNHGKNLEQAIKGNPALESEYKENDLERYPDFGKTVVANDISKKRQELGYNSHFVNLDTKTFQKHNDEIANELYKDDPVRKKIYDENKAEIHDMIDVPGFVNRAVEGIKSGAEGQATTIDKLIGNDNATADIMNGWKKSATGVSAGEKGWYKTLGEMGHMTGLVSEIAAGTGLLKGAGVPTNLASKIMIGETFLGNSIKEGHQKFPDNKLKAVASGAANTVAFMLLPDIVPAGKVSQALGGIKQEINNSISELSDANLSKAALKDAISSGFQKGIEITGAIGKQVGKSSLEFGLLSQFNRYVDKALGLNKDAYEHFHPANEVPNAVKAGAIGNFIPSAIAGYGEFAAGERTKDAIWDAANNPEKVLSGSETLSDAQKRDIQGKVQLLSDTKSLLDENNIPEKQQKSYLVHTLNEKVLKDKAEAATDPTLKKKYTDDAKKSHEIKEGILKGIPEDKVKLNQAIKEVKELHSEGFLSKGASEMLESKKTEEATPKFDEGKVKPFLKFVAQQANNITEDGNFNTGSDARKSVAKQYPSQLIDIANEMFPEYQKIAKEHEGTSEISKPIELNPNLPEDYKLADQQKFEPETNIPNINTESNAGTVREDQGRVPSEGKVTEGSQNNSGENIQRSAEKAGQQPPPANTRPTEESGTNKGEEKTGIKNAISRENRLTFELPKVELPKIGTDLERLKAGKDAVDNGEVNPEEVVSKVLEGKGKVGMQPTEAAAMQYYMHQIGRADELLQKQQALENLEPGQKENIISQRLQLSDLMDRATEANMLAGTAWSDVGHTRQILVDAGFNPSREKSIIKEAYGGTVPKEVQAKLDVAIKERDDAIQARTKLEEELRQKEAELQVAMMKKGRSSSPKTPSDYNAKRKGLLEDLKKAKEEHEKWLKDQGIQKQGLGFTLTGKMIKIIGEYAKTFIDQGAEKLSEVIDKVYEEIKDIFPGIEKNDIRDAVASFHAEKLEVKAAGLENKIKSGDIQPTFDKLKPKFQNDSRWVKANQRVSNAEFKIKGIKKQAFNSDKNMFQRGLGWGSRLFRASVLSGYNVLYKLAAAATIGGVLKRIPEQAIGKMWSGIFSGIAKKAPIEGFPNAKGEAKFYKEFFNPKKFVRNSWEILKGNESDLTRRLGEPYREPQNTVAGKIADRVLSLPTDLHQVIKDPVKRSTFESSVHNGMVWAEKNGLDITDPLVVSSIETAAYKRANYEIFLEKNKLNEAFQNFKNKMEKSGNVGSVGKFVAGFLIPVSTVPTNIARRLLSTSPLGLIRGGAKVVNAYRKGIENLNTEEADAVMRQLKQGSLGTALWLIGWFGASSFGGLYSQYDPNKKRKEGELASDQMMVNGEMIPKPVQHALPLEIIQWAATMRHIYDNYRENKGSDNFDASWKAGLGAIGALAEQIPVIETPVHLINATADPYEGKKLEQDIKRRVEPQILRDTGIIPKESSSSGKKSKPQKPSKSK